MVPDQLIDRTSGRVQTFYDDGAVHVNFADPYCPTGRASGTGRRPSAPASTSPTAARWSSSRARGSRPAPSRAGTPSLGGTVVNMTGHPEAVLARELALCYTAVALVTDLDAGVEGEHGVTQEEVFRVFGENTARLRDLLLDVVAALPDATPTASCQHALDGIDAARQPARDAGR